MSLPREFNLTLARGLVMDPHWIVPRALLVLLCFYLWLISRVSQYWTANAIAVGSLDLAKLSAPDDSAPYLLLLWVCIAGYLLQWAVVSSRKIRTAIPGTVQEAAPGSLHGLLWRAFGVFLIVLALHIPLVDDCREGMPCSLRQ